MLDGLSMKNQKLHYILTIAFALFFLFPLLGFAYFVLQYDMLDDEHIPLFALVLLISAFLGYNIIRRIFDGIRNAAASMHEKITKEVSALEPTSAISEMQEIVRSFDVIEKEMLRSVGKLDERTVQIGALKELSELCYVTFDRDDLFYGSFSNGVGKVD